MRSGWQSQPTLREEPTRQTCNQFVLESGTLTGYNLDISSHIVEIYEKANPS